MSIKRLITAALLAGGLAGALQAAPSAITAASQGIYIVNSNLFASSATWTTELGLAQDLGAGVVRSNWDMGGTLWPSASVWNFTYMDQIAAAIIAKGMTAYYTVPWSYGGSVGAASCQGTNPFLGIGTPSATQCPDNTLSRFRVFATSMTTRYDSVVGTQANLISTYEIPANEPEWGSATTDYIYVAAVAAEEAKAILDVSPTARIVLPALSSPVRTLWKGSLTDGTTNFPQNEYYGAFLSAFSSSMSYIGHGVTMSSFTTSIHPYYEANGGAQTWQTVMTTITAMSGNNGNATPTIDYSEVNIAGGTPTGPSSGWDVKMSSAIIKAYAIMKSSNTAWAGVGGTFIVHNMQGLPISITTGTPVAYTKLGSYNVTKKIFTAMLGFTPQGDQGDGSNVRIYKFTSGSKRIWIAWCESGTSSWSLNPAQTVLVTDVNGSTTAQSASSFTPYTLTTSPIIVEENSVNKSLRGVSLTGVTF